MLESLNPPALRESLLTWWVAARPIEGESLCGDSHVVAPIKSGMLIGVIDGLGHGEQAAAAARAAVDALERYAELPLDEVVWRCHEELRKTRGAVLSLASFHSKEGAMKWLGVGNVAGVLFRANPLLGESAREELLLRGGVVGYRLPSAHVRTLAVHSGDTLVFATDGIHGGFSAEISADIPPKRIAENILARYGKSTDDALVLVARYGRIFL